MEMLNEARQYLSVLRNYPKRVDVWSVYIDLLIKQEDFNHVRYVRVDISLLLPSIFMTGNFLKGQLT